MNRTAFPDRISTYLEEIEGIVKSISRSDVRRVVDRLFEGWQQGQTTYIIGNGGSASTGSHMMNDLSKMTTIEGKRRFRAIALTDNMPYITAIGNDIEYADVFVEQLRNLLLPKDILIAISGSGNSENIIRAARYANEIGATVIGLCGNPGSRLCACSDVAVTIPANSICQQEDGHLILNHAIALALRERIAATA
ncbi:MAG TPA: SIS domain-containing protein [Candidatus Baltobacteraceae bacterium]|nr:SIS domain-containing protein [Candidatus Baltobacteraceae bacterium]